MVRELYRKARKTRGSPHGGPSFLDRFRQFTRSFSNDYNIGLIQALPTFTKTYNIMRD